MSDTTAVRELLDTYAKALNTSDAALAASLYAPDGVFMPYQAPTAAGPQQLLEAYRQIFEQIQLDVEFTIEDLTVDGGTAHAVTGSAGRVTVHADGSRAPERNRELFVFVRTDEGWRIARYMFNKTAPASAGS
ncbi:hypothetical protein GCM10009759_20740 [Kitasatospora saccharophila]|uniref:SnoaL-like domain-containing protein n=1 Tax=Kitasatospora saccharophila TaxID=407973 RepID=A0ABN2WLY0_9ACTN